MQMPMPMPMPMPISMSTQTPQQHDRVGLAWRDALASGILSHLDQIDVVEVIAEDYFHAAPKRIRAMQTLARQVPLMLHGVAMGLASTLPVDTKRLDKMARLVNAIEPYAWSEHLAFVRAGNIEIGHLAAPPRTDQVIAGTLSNIATAKKIVGTLPHLENIATLILPPASTMDEAEWTHKIIAGSGAPLLLDLHNLYANAINFNSTPSDAPQTLLHRMPLDRVQYVHLSGGMWIDEPSGAGKKRLLDDHIHDVPDDVFALLTELAANTSQPLTVIIERDGAYPQFKHLLQQVSHARQALAAGRTQLRMTTTKPTYWQQQAA